MKKLDIKEIQNLSYTDFVSFIKEENRPSGGKDTIREIAINSFINENSKVLEIGCTNGFSSLEINKLVNCHVIGIDINQNSVNNANERIKENGLDINKVKFEYGDAENLRFDDNEFDLIICGNALSFISDKNKALHEIKRVLKPNGFISLVPIWYKSEPDMNIVHKVNQELGFNIVCTKEQDWMNFENLGLELYFKKNYQYIKASSQELNHYIDTMIDNKMHLHEYSSEEIQVIKTRWKRTMRVFNENAGITNYSVILLRKCLVPEEVTLLSTKPLN